MQARQPLPEPIDLRCCQAIDVVLRNREPRPETVYVELALLDSSQEREIPMSLGVQEAAAAALRFDVPSHPQLHAFDALLVWFHLDESRQQRSPKLAIDRFDLIR